jgi:hypothetical protein
MRTRRFKGGNFTLAALGKAAMDALIPATLFYAATRIRSKRNRSNKRFLRSRRY